MVFKRKNIDFNVFRPKASSVILNFFTCYISLLSLSIYLSIYLSLYIYVYIYWVIIKVKKHFLLKRFNESLIKIYQVMKKYVYENKISML